MPTSIYFDLGVLAFLLLFVVLGAARGLFRTLMGFLTVAVSIVGAAWLSATFSSAVTARLYPHVEERLLAVLNTEGGGAAFAELLSSFGADAELANALYAGLDGAADEIVRAALTSVLQTLVQGALLLVSFFALLLVLKLLTRTVGLVFKLPVLRSLDRLGGGAFGLFEGAALVFLAVYAARSLGSDFFVRGAQDTQLLTLFVEHTPKSLLYAILQM